MNYFQNSCPLPSDYFGTLWALAGIRDGIVVEHGAPGTMAYNAVNFRMFGPLEVHGRFFTSGLDEDDVIMGREDKLIAAVKEADRLYGPRLISLVATGVTSVIGLDLQGIAKELEGDVSAEILVFDGGGFRGDYRAGKEEVCLRAAERFVKEPAAIDKASVNILGVSADDFNHASDIAELKRLLNLQGLTVNTVFPLDTDVEFIGKMSRAGLNLVPYDTGLETARLLERRFGTPWLHGLPFGLKGTADWFERLADILGCGLERSAIAGEMKAYGQIVRDLLSRQQPDNAGVAISAANEYTVGLADFIQNECGMPVRIAALKKTPSAEDACQSLKALGIETIMIEPAHDELMEEIAAHNIKIFFGNSYELNAAHDVPIKIHAAFPAFDRQFFYDGTPFVGFKGNSYLVQLLANKLSEHPEVLRV